MTRDVEEALELARWECSQPGAVLDHTRRKLARELLAMHEELINESYDHDRALKACDKLMTQVDSMRAVVEAAEACVDASRDIMTEGAAREMYRRTGVLREAVDALRDARKEDK